MAEDERSRLAEASWALYGQGVGTVVVDGLLSAGARSRVWRLVAVGREGTRHYAVKWFRPRYRSQWAGSPRGSCGGSGSLGDSVATEFAALTNLLEVLPAAAAPAGRFQLRCPLPVQAWDWGYAMSAVPGQRLDDAVARRVLAAAEFGQLGRDLVGALIAFHGVHGGPYGDFQPANVLLGPARDVYLLDPAPAGGWLRCWAGEPAPPHLAVDVAHWMYATAVGMLRQAARHPGTLARRPGGVARLGQLSRALADAAVEVTGDPGLAAQIERCRADYWTQLSNHSRRHSLAAAAGRRLLDPRRPTRRHGR
ncbi:MAG TPA: hypothetical protein VMU51_28585 [Mycobacteriales bacterium]|nr:hypothetical protein [Mycobacteriales bacterium]